MTSFVQLQTDLTNKLLSEPSLENIHTFSQRQAMVEGRAEDASIWLTERNGRSGCGIMVEMPIIEVPAPNVPGPEYLVLATLLVVEQPDTNMDPNHGTLLSAEEVAQRTLEILHGFLIPNVGGLYAAAQAIVPVQEFANRVAYRVRLNVRQQRLQTPRVASVEITGGANIALACATAGSAVWFTTDESFPGPSNPAATLYTVALSPVEGQVIRAAAYAPGMIGSHVTQATITI